MKSVKVTFDKVKALYPDCRVLGVQEVWKEGKGWHSPYYCFDGTAENQIEKAYESGATSVNLLIEDKFGIHTPDYKVKELIREVFCVSYYILNREGKKCAEATKKPIVDICEEFYQQTAEVAKPWEYSSELNRILVSGGGFLMVVELWMTQEEKEVLIFDND